jgi:hypothetical protein
MRYASTISLRFLAAIIVGQPGGTSAQVEIDQVRITLNTNRKAEQVSGRLYRVDARSSDREWAANVMSDGKLSRLTRCVMQEHFEVEIDRPIAFPDNPVRAQCGRTLSFSFTRPTFAFKTSPRGSFLDAPTAQIDVRSLSKLEQVARLSGNSEVARAAGYGVVATTAAWLGDSRLDKYVKRSPDAQFGLVLNEQGIAALKVQQAQFKVPASGQIDENTQRLISSRFIKQPAKVKSTYCLIRYSSEVLCSFQKLPLSATVNALDVEIYYLNSSDER